MKGRYVRREEGRDAELTYSCLPDALSCRSIVERLVAGADADAFRIVPLRPLVSALRQEHSEKAALFEV